jgi:hypothetical protein
MPGRRRRGLWQRGRARKPPRRSILIVCEDSVSAPAYFRALVYKHFRTPLVEVQVGPSEGSAPRSVVDFAIKQMRRRVREAKRSALVIPYDEVWCVMDVEAPTPHGTLNEALDRVRQKGKMHAALCNPCFEYWLLLHFQCCQRPFATSRDAVSALKQYMPDYDKGRNDWSDLAERMKAAEANAIRAMKRYGLRRDVPGSNPSTNLHELIDALRKALA